MAASIGLRVMGWGSVMIATGTLASFSALRAKSCFTVSWSIAFGNSPNIQGRPESTKRVILYCKENPLVSFVLTTIAALGLVLVSYSLMNATFLIGKALYLQTSVSSLTSPFIDAAIGAVSAFICSLTLGILSGVSNPAPGVQPFGGQAFQLGGNNGPA